MVNKGKGQIKYQELMMRAAHLREQMLNALDFEVLTLDFEGVDTGF